MLLTEKAAVDNGEGQTIKFMLGGLYVKEQHGTKYYGFLLKAAKLPNGVLNGYITTAGFLDELLHSGMKTEWRYLSGGVPVPED